MRPTKNHIREHTVSIFHVPNTIQTNVRRTWLKKLISTWLLSSLYGFTSKLKPENALQFYYVYVTYRIIWINVIALVLINWCTLYDNRFITSHSLAVRCTLHSYSLLHELLLGILQLEIVLLLLSTLYMLLRFVAWVADCAAERRLNLLLSLFFFLFMRV